MASANNISNDAVNNVLRQKLCCSIPDCTEYCDLNPRVCTECPQNKRTYLYCSLHELHSIHKDQLSARRNNIIVVLASSNKNTDLAIGLSSNTNDSILNVRGATGRRKRNRDGDEELCLCGCNKSYDYTAMSDCKGLNCNNRVNRICVPNSWLCSCCKL